MNQWIKRGGIFYVSNDGKRTGSEIRKDRPAVVVSNDANNKYGSVVEVVYLTSGPKKNLPTHVVINSTGRRSVALCEQPTPVAVERLQNWIAQATAKEMSLIDKALMTALALDEQKRRKRR